MEILYPVAYARPYEAVHIEDAERGRSHFCFGCDREMVIRRGRIRQPHFAHKADSVQCKKDNTLHEAAKAFICQGFIDAIARGAEYQVGYPCEGCQTPIKVDVAIEGASIASERVVVKGTRSDLAIFQPDGSLRVIIEVVVTHDLESDTKQRYEEANYPVVTVEPSWETLPGLHRAAIGSRILNVKNDGYRYCRNCQDARKQKRNVAQRKHQKRHTVTTKPSEMYRRKRKQDHRLAWGLAKSLVAGIMPHSRRIPPLIPITHDKCGSPLNTRDQGRVMASAQKLARLGFQQQTKRPTLFLYQAGRWGIYADLDSVDYIPVLYAFRNGEMECEGCLLKAVGEIFDQQKVSYRLRFEDAKAHDHSLYF